MSFVLEDLTPVLRATIRKGAGPQRWQHPAWIDHLPPCNHACPAGENIQGWLAHARAGEFEEAWRTLVSDNPLPGIHGRACYHPCETQLQSQGPGRGGLDPRGRTLPRRHGGGEGLDGAGRRADRQEGADRRRRARGSFLRLAPPALRPRGRDPRRDGGAGRHAPLRHPRLPPAAGGDAARDRPHRSDGRPLHDGHARRGRDRRRWRKAASTPASSRSGRTRATTSTSRPPTAGR